MTRLRSIAALVALLAAMGVSSQSAAQCVSRGEGQQMVAQGQVTPLPVALQSAGLAGAQVLSADLCRAGSGWVYQVRYRHGGQVSQASIPAGGGGY